MSQSSRAKSPKHCQYSLGYWAYLGTAKEGGLKILNARRKGHFFTLSVGHKVT